MRKKTKSEYKNMKVSPLLATILIIGFTIVLAVLLINWALPFVQDLQKEPFNENEDVCLEWKKEKYNEDIFVKGSGIFLTECVSWEKKEEYCQNVLLYKKEIDGNRLIIYVLDESGDYYQRVDLQRYKEYSKSYSEVCMNYTLENYCNQNPNDNEICSCVENEIIIREYKDWCYNKYPNQDCELEVLETRQERCIKAVPKEDEGIVNFKVEHSENITDIKAGDCITIHSNETNTKFVCNWDIENYKNGEVPKGLGEEN